MAILRKTSKNLLNHPEYVAHAQYRNLSVRCIINKLTPKIWGKNKTGPYKVRHYKSCLLKIFFIFLNLN